MKVRLYRVVFQMVLLMCITALAEESGSCAAKSTADEKKPKTKAVQKADEKKTVFKVIAYYFHGNFRCDTCRRMEAYADEAIKTSFAAELKDGALEWRAVNVEGKGNEHFIDDYKLYSKSLVLVEMKDDKQVKWKNLENIWALNRDKDAFTKYVRDEVSLYLKDKPKDDQKKEEKKAKKKEKKKKK